MTSIQERLVVFIPTLQALDAMLPLTCGFMRRPEREVFLIVTDFTLEKFASNSGADADIRIQFLRSIPNVKILLLSDFIADSAELTTEVLSNAHDKIIQSASENGSSFKLIFTTSANAIEIYLAALSKAHNIRCTLVADSMFPIHPSNRRILHNSGDEKPPTIPTSDLTLFDSILLPHEYAFEALGGTFPLSRVRITKHARFSSEWLTSWINLCGGTRYDKPKDSLSVTFLLRPHSNAVYWKEVVRTVQLLRKLYNATCTIQIHQEDGLISIDELNRAYAWLHEINNQITIQPGTTPTIYSIARSDLVIDTGTSAAFEAIVLGVPLIQFKYLQAFKPLLSELFPLLSFKCRDEIVAYLKNVRRPLSPLREDEQAHLRKSFIGEQSLDAYVEAVMTA